MERTEMPMIFKMTFADQLGRENNLTINEAYSYCDMVASLERIYTTTPYTHRVIQYEPGAVLWTTVVYVDRVRETRSWSRMHTFRTKRSRCYQNMIHLLQEMQWSYTICNRYIDGHHCVVLIPSMKKQ